MYLFITNAGKAAETTALQTGGPMSKVKEIVVGSGVPPNNGDEMVKLTDLVHQEYASEILVVDRPNPSTLKLTGNIPENTVVRIREIGIKLEDGTLFAYNAYMPEAPDGGGMYKGLGFAFTLHAILSREQMGTLEFTYSPIDVNALAEQIANDARASIDLYLNAYFIGITANIAGLNAAVYSLQDQLNTLKYQHVLT